MSSDEPPISFGQWLRRRRKALDLTQIELAARVPCARGTIRRIEADDLRPSKALAERLADILNVPATERADFVQFARHEGSTEAPPVQPSVDHRPATMQPPAQPHTRRHVLPDDLAPLIGRQYAVEVATEILARPDVRLLTLVGPPGVGKTRLGRAISTRIQQQYRNGACFVELAPLHDPDYVLPAIAQAIELTDSGAPLPLRLAERLRSEELLLILDNCEHLLAAAPAIGALLAAAPELTILCTSRAPLRIYGEHEFVVPPLALPALDQNIPLATFESNPAVALFLTRARAAQPMYRVNDAGLRQIAAICHRLDGLPLAIELAANRAKLFTPEALLARLEQRLPILTTSTRDAPARQRTLEAAIAWSYDLLDQPACLCLARLSIFAGDATLAAIEAVCGDDMDVLAAVTTLVDHHLLQATPSEEGEVRFSMLETIREFALTHLNTQSARADVQRRHGQYYLSLAVAAERGLQGAEQVRWMDRLQADENNLRAAFVWSLADAGDLDLGLRAAAGLWWFWWTNGQVGEGRRWLDDLLRHAQTQGRDTTQDYARALLGSGILAFFGGDFAAAQPRFAAAQALSLDLADAITHGYATFMIGTVLVLTGQRDPGYATLEQGSQILHSVGEAADWHRAVTSLASTLLVLESGDLHAAQHHADTGMAIFAHLGQPYGIGLSYNYQGDVARLRGAYAVAAMHYQAALPLLRSAKARSEIPAVLHNLALVYLAQGDVAQAHALLIQGFEQHRELGNSMGMAECLNGLAAALVTLNQAQPAATLLGAIANIQAALHAPLFAAEQTLYEHTTTRLQTMLDPQVLEHEQQRGRAMSLSEIIKFVDTLTAASTPPT